MWRDRVHAGRELAHRLVEAGYADVHDAIVLGVPRGGVEVAREVADRLHVPLDVVVVRKIGAPGAPEFAAGAVDLGGNVYQNPAAGVSKAWLQTASVSEHGEALRRATAYRSGRPPLELGGRTVIMVDDGVATGLTAIAALRWLGGSKAKKRVFAAPVMSRDAAQKLRSEADDVITLDTPSDFMAVGAYYQDFPQLTDDDVTSLLESARTTAR